jgi:hypothetical protein
MPMDQSITEEFPILKGDDAMIAARLRKARKRLEKVFREFDVAGDVIIVCETALEKQNVEHDTMWRMLFVATPATRSLRR